MAPGCLGTPHSCHACALSRLFGLARAAAEMPPCQRCSMLSAASPVMPKLWLAGCAAVLPEQDMSLCPVTLCLLLGLPIWLEEWVKGVCAPG